MSRNAHFLFGAGHGVPELHEAARAYAERSGVSNVRRPASYGGTVITPEMQQSIASAYDRLPTHDPAAEPAFGAMREETKRQFDFLTSARTHGGLGIGVEVTKTDPYGGPAPMMSDLFHDRRIKVLGTSETGGHPFFSDDENDMFRAVHDVFGHAATGRGFDRHGEEAAFQSHATMFSSLARRALATETRGQNAALIVGGGQSFAPQKVALLPSRLASPRFTLGTSESRGLAVRQARTFNAQQFGGLLGALKTTVGR